MKVGTDLEYYHNAQEQLKKMQQFFEFLEIEEIPKCRYYSYDDGACEEYCKHPKIERGTIDFNSKQECWQCKFREIMKK
jgi:hypothetical protein